MSVTKADVSRFFVAALLLMATVVAQTSTGRLEGTVTDQTGAAVASATVVVVNTRTNVSLTAKTNEIGYYLFTLPPSTYRLTAEAQGFRKSVVENIELNSGLTLTEALKLEVGSVAESVTVEATTVRVQTSDATIGRSVTMRDIDTLPQLGRAPLALVAFVPGASVNPGDATFTQINGTRQGSNNTKLDGIDANDAVVPRLGLSLTSVNTDSVEEVRLITNGAKAEYGRNAGGQVEMITRSGSNAFHGGLFDYMRNRVFNANNYFSNASSLPRPPYIQNIFGGQAGGPVFKDKTFFFFNYQGRRTTQQTERNRTVLTEEARSGLFRWKTPGSGAVNSFNIPTNDPRGKGIDPMMKALIALSPTPNHYSIGDGLNTGGFRFNNPSGSWENQLTAKFDHNLWSGHRIFYRHSRQTNESIDALNNADAVFPGRPTGRQGGLRWGYSIGSDWAIKPTLINEFRIGYQSASVAFIRPDRVQGPQALPNTFTNPILPNFAQGRNSPVIDLSESQTFVKGKSTWKWGGTYRRVLQYGYNDAGIYANLSLARTNGNLAAATVGPNGAAVIGTADRQMFENLYNDLLGAVSDTAITYYSDLKTWQPAGTSRVRNTMFRDWSLFLQNDYKLMSNLTFNIGLRYEMYGPPHELDGFQGTFDKMAQVNMAANIADLSIQQSSQWHPRDKNNFAPRFGFSWDPFRDGKTAIRGSYGLFFDRIIGATSSAVDGSTPGFSYAGTSLATLDFPVGTRLAENPPVSKQPATVPITPGADRRISTTTFDPNLATGYTHQFNITIQREIMRNTILDVGWVRTQGVKLFAFLDYNQPRIFGDFLKSFKEMQTFIASGAAPPAGNTFVRAFGTPAAAVTAVGSSTFSQGLSGTAADTLDRSNYTRYASAGISNYYLRNFPQFNQFWVGGNVGKLWYNGLQATLRRTAGSLRTTLNYTYSKSMDTISVDGNGATNTIDNFNLNQFKARGDADRPHAFNASGIYTLPFGKGQKYLSDTSSIGGKALNQLVGGWDLGVLALAQSGSVMTLSSGRRTGPSLSNTWINYSGDRNIGAIDKRGADVFYFSADQIAALTAASAFPGAGEFGSSGRNSFRGPKFFSFDFSIVKKFPMPWENHFVTFRAEMYNALNHANFNNPSVSIATPASFGKIASTINPARIMQFALRYDF